MPAIITPPRDIWVPTFRYRPDDYARYTRLIRRRGRSVPVPAEWQAAIAFDAATDGGLVSATSLSFPHTCTGSGLVLLVGVLGDLIGGADDVTGVTYNGAALTLVDKYTAVGADRYTYLFLLAGPATGAHNVVVSASSSHDLFAGAISFSGCAAAGQPDAHRTNSGSSAPLTTALTTIANNCWTVVFAASYASNNAPTAGTGSTRRTFDASFGAWGFFDSNGPITPAGSYSMTTSYPTPIAHDLIHLMLSLAPDTGGGGLIAGPLVNAPRVKGLTGGALTGR